MKTPQDNDPQRWKDAPPTASGTEAELAVVTRLILDAPPPDELRLAHLAREVLRQASRMQSRVLSRVALPMSFGQWRRTAVLVGIGLLAGGVATAVSGTIIQHFTNAGAKPVPTRDPVDHGSLAPRGKRRWRLDVNLPTKLDLSVGPEGTEVDVVNGQAAITGAGVPGILELNPGASWRAPVPPEATTLRPDPPAPAMRVESMHSAARAGAHPVRLALSGPGPETSRAPTGSAVRAPLAAPSRPFARPATEPPPLSPTEEGSGTASRAWVAPAVKLQSPAREAHPTESEAALVTRALGHLRRDHDPLWAIGELDQRDRQYPRGILTREAALARAEALLALDRTSDALTVLDGIQLKPTAADRPIRLARGELRAQDGRRAEAIGDFDQVLIDGSDDDVAERALFGRAVCRLRGGDLGGARGDLRAYNERFPDGHHHGDVEKMLRRLGG